MTFTNTFLLLQEALRSLPARKKLEGLWNDSRNCLKQSKHQKRRIRGLFSRLHVHLDTRGPETFEELCKRGTWSRVYIEQNYFYLGLSFVYEELISSFWFTLTRGWRSRHQLLNLLMATNYIIKVTTPPGNAYLSCCCWGWRLESTEELSLSWFLWSYII